MNRRSILRACTIGMAALLTSSCAVGPTESDIEDFLQNTLESVNGAWSGTIGGNQATLSFNLAQNGAVVTGSGSMREGVAGNNVPITITGSFNRPSLSLTFNGMVFEGVSVQGTAQGSYTSVAGVSTQIRLVGTNYDKVFALLISEQ